MKEGILFLLIVGTLICLLIFLFGGVSITIPKAEQWNIIIKITYSVLFILTFYGIGKWYYERKYPAQEAHAVVVEIRTKTETPAVTDAFTMRNSILLWGKGFRIGIHNGIHNKSHFAIFELDTGERIELKVKASDFPILKEGMRGTLTYRRAWMKV